MRDLAKFSVSTLAYRCKNNTQIFSEGFCRELNFIPKADTNISNIHIHQFHLEYIVNMVLKEFSFASLSDVSIIVCKR